MAFSLHRFLKSIIIKEENTLTPKEIEIIPGGSAGTKTTLTSSQTSNQTLTLPLGGSDTIVARATADTLTSKTIVAADNTVIVDATNVTATALNAALTEIQFNIDDHVNATPNAHDAPAINVTPSGNLSSSNVQDALDELQTDIDTGATDLANHLADTTDAHDASAISNSPSGNLAATDVQAALNELQADIDTRILSSEKGAVSGVATLDGGGKVPSSQLPASVMQYQGQWNASTNTPTLTNGTGSAGDVYEVNVAGSTNFGAGAISFNIGDWAVYDGSVWEKSINSNEVVSVNGLTGAVTLDTDDISEGSTNLYFTNGRAQTALSSHTSASTGVHGVTGSVVGTTDTQALTNKDIDGGTASNTSRVTLPKDTKTTLDGLTRKQGTLVYDTTSNKPYYDDGSLLKPIGSGTGGAKNLITDGDADNVSASIFTAYADAAGTRPVDGTGGSPTVSTSVTSTNPLEGTKSFLLTKDAANRQGQGWSVPFTVDTAYKAKSLKISVDYIVNSGTFVAGSSSTESDVIWYIYDVTNSQLIEPSNIKMFSNNSSISDKFEATFQTSATGTSYRLIAHVQSVSALAYELKVDNITVSPQTYVFGSPETYLGQLVTTGSWVTATTYTGYYWRVGDRLRAQIKVATTGAPTATTLTVNLPTGLSIDSSKGTYSYFDTSLGRASFYFTGSTSTKYFNGEVLHNNTTSVTIVTGNHEASGGSNVPSLHRTTATNATFPFTFANGDYIIFDYEVPIQGWSSSVQMSDSADTRVVAFLADSATTTVGTSDTAVIHPTKQYDTHNAYNASTGVFTVPVSGYYSFKWRAQSSTSITAGAIGDIFVCDLHKNGSIVMAGLTFVFQQTSVAVGVRMLGSGSIYCVAGDTVTLQTRRSGTLPSFNLVGNVGTFFSGERISGPSAIAASETVAAFASSSSGQSIPTTTDTVVVFNQKTTDTHNAFNTSTGVFTAPRAGFLQVQASLWYENGFSAITLSRLVVNGVAVRIGPVKYNSSDRASSHIEGTVYVTAGQQVTIETWQSNASSRSLNSGPLTCYVNYLMK